MKKQNFITKEEYLQYLMQLALSYKQTDSSKDACLVLEKMIDAYLKENYLILFSR